MRSRFPPSSPKDHQRLIAEIHEYECRSQHRKTTGTPKVDDSLFCFTILLYVLGTEVSQYLCQYITHQTILSYIDNYQAYMAFQVRQQDLINPDKNGVLLLNSHSFLHRNAYGLSEIIHTHDCHGFSER